METKKKRGGTNCGSVFTPSGDDETNPAEQNTTQATTDQLLARATRINSSLLVSLNAVLGVKDAIDADALACKQLVYELENWERALTELENAVVTQHATDIKDDSQRSFELDSNRLLQTIESQKNQINTLENKLRKLLQDAQAATEAVSETKPRQDQEPVKSDPQFNRVLITVDRNGNLKFPLGQNIVTIGRQPTNDIHIRSRYLSRFHARIINDAKGALIEDLDSANGVIVNAMRVRRCLLRSGDRITLGKTQLQYIDIEEDTEDAGQA